MLSDRDDKIRTIRMEGSQKASAASRSLWRRCEAKKPQAEKTKTTRDPDTVLGFSTPVSEAL